MSSFLKAYLISTTAMVALTTVACSGSPTASTLLDTEPSSASSVQLSVSGNTYPVVVLTNTGTFFQECFIFNPDGSFRSNGLTGTWEEVGNESGLWSATTTSAEVGFEIRWTGLDLTSTYISGFGIRLADETLYRVFGRTGACPTRSTARGYER
ncbi:MAG: hypothetical protein HC921_15935 [Synechococcaceae cyanobacterium SM2_3_1]|nr:hypothetical protein [Synechococcaceae cyanobacterium SM2_3_1]